MYFIGTQHQMHVALKLLVKRVKCEDGRVEKYGTVGPHPSPAMTVFDFSNLLLYAFNLAEESGGTAAARDTGGVGRPCLGTSSFHVW